MIFLESGQRTKTTQVRSKMPNEVESQDMDMDLMVRIGRRRMPFEEKYEGDKSYADN